MPPSVRAFALPSRVVAAAAGCLAVAVLAACSESPRRLGDTSAGASASVTLEASSSSGAGASAQDAGAAAPSDAAASSTTPGATPGASAAAGTGPDGPFLVLEPDGLGVASGASIRQVPFGTQQSTLATVLARTLGPVRAARLDECGQGPRRQLSRPGFSALFAGTRFVGWTASAEGGLHLTTANGVGVGSTLGQVRAAFAGTTVTTGSLGPEFTSTGGLGGILDGPAPTAKVTTFYAGETCFFR